MSQNPLNLVVRLLLELAGVVGLFRLGDILGDGGSGVALGVVLAAGGIAAWAVFNVPDDGSRSGKAPVAVPGPVRLIVELTVLGVGAVGWWLAGPVGFAWAYTIALVAHYVMSWDRLAWLLRSGPRESQAVQPRN